MDKMEIGKMGESVAENFLETAGYKILEKNWYHRHKELDLIAVDDDELVVVEVKSRQAPALDSPAISIDRKKQRNLVFAANAYVRMNRISLEVRFDVIWVIFKGDRPEIEHIRNAFVPSL